MHTKILRAYGVPSQVPGVLGIGDTKVNKTDGSNLTELASVSNKVYTM